jgi:hypothetical protein
METLPSQVAVVEDLQTARDVFCQTNHFLHQLYQIFHKRIWINRRVMLVTIEISSIIKRMVFISALIICSTSSVSLLYVPADPCSIGKRMKHNILYTLLQATSRTCCYVQRKTAYEWTTYCTIEFVRCMYKSAFSISGISPKRFVLVPKFFWI